jgi:hypothetical protein
MSKRRLCLLTLFIIAGIFAAPASQAQSEPADKVTYVLSNAVLFNFSVDDRFIAARDKGLVAGSPPGLLNASNWTVRMEAKTDIVDAAGSVVESRGSVTQFRPAVVRVFNPSTANRLAFDPGRKLDLTNHNVTFIFSPTGIVLDQIEQFSKIDVSFGESFPSNQVLQEPRNWLVRTIALNTGQEAELIPSAVIVDPVRQNKLVSLMMGQLLDRATHKIIIRFQQPEFPEFTIGEPQKTRAGKAFTAAKGKDDADIYFSGTAIGARNSKPLYAIETKLGYLQSLGRRGAIGGKMTLDADQGSDVDPDSITATASYEKFFLFGPRPTAIRFIADFLGAEFDRQDQTRNLTTGAYGKLILPSKFLNEHNITTVELIGGFEAGHNYRNSITRQGIGNFWRPKFGVNAYFLSLKPWKLERITFSAEYLLRLPRSAEPFTGYVGGEKTTFLTRKPRHDFGINLDFMFSKALGLTIQDRYGSLPPAFKFVNNKVSAGLVIKLKQANK